MKWQFERIVKYVRIDMENAEQSGGLYALFTAQSSQGAKSMVVRTGTMQALANGSRKLSDLGHPGRLTLQQAQLGNRMLKGTWQRIHQGDQSLGDVAWLPNLPQYKWDTGFPGGAYRKGVDFFPPSRKVHVPALRRAA